MVIISGDDKRDKKIKQSLTDKKRKKDARIIKKEIEKLEPAKYTYNNLRNKTPSKIIKNSKDGKCRQRFMGAIRKPGGRSAYVWKTGCSGRPHISMVEVKSSERPHTTQKVKVQCSCEYFVYTLEIVNTGAGISENKFALPQWPVIRNPSGSRHLCKHLYKLGDNLIQRARNDISTTRNRGLSQNKADMLTDDAYSKSRKEANVSGKAIKKRRRY